VKTAKEKNKLITLPDIRDEIIPLLASRVSAKVVLPNKINQ
jgi:hypothetical protein